MKEHGVSVSKASDKESFIEIETNGSSGHKKDNRKNMNSLIPIEEHPLQPFLPEGAKLLMLGSFPPQQKRWSMEFYYPNFQNDMWRIMGYLFHGDKDYFVDKPGKVFKKEEIVAFAKERGLAFYDTASAVRRLQDNASDKFLEVVEPTDVELLLRHLPQCRAICTTGQKATDTLCALFEISQPSVGGYALFNVGNKEMRLYRMPSSSRAYPLALEKKAAFYREMFRELEMIDGNNE